jgi:muramidase (phage lysozyme)
MNKKAVLIIGGAGVGLLAWYLTRQKNTDSTPENWLELLPDVNDTLDTISNRVTDLTGGMFMRVSAMAQVTQADLNNANVQAFLRVIRRGEGTADSNGYRRIFGGQLFTSYADHPRIVVRKSGYSSSAAGAYQFIISSWDETKRIMNLKDFSPASQDLAAVGRIMARGALDDVKAGRFETAIKKVAKEWASLPFSPYGQPTISMDTAKSVYTAFNGNFSTEGTFA